MTMASRTGAAQAPRATTREALSKAVVPQLRDTEWHIKKKETKKNKKQSTKASQTWYDVTILLASLYIFTSLLDNLRSGALWLGSYFFLTDFSVLENGGWEFTGLPAFRCIFLCDITSILLFILSLYIPHSLPCLPSIIYITACNWWAFLPYSDF